MTDQPTPDQHGAPDQRAALAVSLPPAPAPDLCDHAGVVDAVGCRAMVVHGSRDVLLIVTGHGRAGSVFLTPAQARELAAVLVAQARCSENVRVRLSPGPPREGRGSVVRSLMCVTHTSSGVLGDRDLVERAQAGDEPAVEELLAAVLAAAGRYCLRRLGTYAAGRQLAEDVAQEVCLGVLAGLSGYRATGAPFEAWVYRIAAHKVADAQRRPYRVDELDEVVERAAGPEDLAVTRSELEEVLERVGRLPSLAARIVRLRAEGYSAGEVGALVGMSANAVRVAHHRGMTRLRCLEA